MGSARFEAGIRAAAAVADNGVADWDFDWDGNDMVMRSLLKWVTRWHSPYAIRAYLPIVLCE